MHEGPVLHRTHAGATMRQADPLPRRAVQIFGSETAQFFGAGVIRAERRPVAFKAQVSQPACDIHRRFLRLGDARGAVSSCWRGCVQEQKMGLSHRDRVIQRHPANPERLSGPVLVAAAGHAQHPPGRSQPGCRLSSPLPCPIRSAGRSAKRTQINSTTRDKRYLSRVDGINTKDQSV